MVEWELRGGRGFSFLGRDWIESPIAHAELLERSGVMGLSIGYQMKVKTDAEEARRLMGALRARAAGVSFDRVTEVREYDPPDGRYAFAEGREGDRWEKPGCRYLTRNREDG